MRKKANYCFFLFSVCLFLFSSCGLDVVYYLDTPYLTHNTPEYTTAFDNRYFEFTTNDRGNSGQEGFDYLGTAVYYKIYNNVSTMNSNIAAVSSLNSSTNESAAASHLIDSYKYQPLGLSSGTKNPLVPVSDDGNNQRVYIRLSNYLETVSADYKATVRIRPDGGDDSSWSEQGIPLRTGNRYTFDFGRDYDDVSSELAADRVENAVPASDDSSTIGDVSYSSSFTDSDKKIWYVDLYAIAVGQDSSFTQYYSGVLHLGSVAIDPNEDDN